MWQGHGGAGEGEGGRVPAASSRRVTAASSLHELAVTLRLPLLTGKRTRHTFCTYCTCYTQQLKDHFVGFNRLQCMVQFYISNLQQ
jgi:hypothetical protein